MHASVQLYVFFRILTKEVQEFLPLRLEVMNKGLLAPSTKSKRFGGLQYRSWI